MRHALKELPGCRARLRASPRVGRAPTERPAGRSRMAPSSSAVHVAQQLPPRVALDCPLKGRFVVPAEEASLGVDGRTLEQVQAHLFSLVEPASALARPPISNFSVGCGAPLARLRPAGVCARTADDELTRSPAHPSQGCGTGPERRHLRGRQPGVPRRPPEPVGAPARARDAPTRPRVMPSLRARHARQPHRAAQRSTRQAQLGSRIRAVRARCTPSSACCSTACCTASAASRCWPCRRRRAGTAGSSSARSTAS